MIKQIENNLAGQPRFNLGGTLVSIGKTILQNSNGKNYKIATITYENNEGQKKVCGAAIYEGNYAHASLEGKELEVGKEFLCTATVVATAEKTVVYMQMSHLAYGAGFADVADFNVANAAIGATKVTIGAEVKS